MARVVARRVYERFGNLKELAEPPIVAQSSKRIEREPLRKLLLHEAHAYVVKGFLSKERCEECAELLCELDAKPWSVGRPASSEMRSTDVLTTDLPFNVAKAKNRLEEYFDSVESRLNRLRPHSPSDLLRLQLDEAYDFGARLNRSELNRSHAPDNVRVMRKNGGGFIHVDALTGAMSSEKGVFSANTYLQTPHAGGELEVFPLTWRSKTDFYRNASVLSLCVSDDPDDQRVLERELDVACRKETVKIIPEVGDLILLNVERPHRVCDPILGNVDRVSLQTFIERPHRSSPLLIGS